MSGTEYTAGDYLAGRLAEAGADRVFGVPGDYLLIPADVAVAPAAPPASPLPVTPQAADPDAWPASPRPPAGSWRRYRTRPVSGCWAACQHGQRLRGG